ncbi:MAG: hypothetical protein CL609_09150 [Anaerolineaceae bacterium]|nr:hypothetical protein [Anaerolineaceae bacterium]
MFLISINKRNVLGTANNPIKSARFDLFIQGTIRNSCFEAISLSFFLSEITRSIENLNNFIGNFCGVIHDKKKNILTLFTDRNAVNQLYYFYDGENLIVSSSLDYVIRNCNQKLTLDWTTWSDMFIFHHIHGSRTYLNEIKTLSMGEIVKINLSKKTVTSIQNYQILNQPIISKTREVVISEIAELSKKSVQKAIRASNDQFQMMLSGGLDTRLIAASLHSLNKSSITYTINTDVGSSTEEDFAKLVSQELGWQNFFIPYSENWYSNYILEYFVQSNFESWFHPWFKYLTDMLPINNSPYLLGIDGDALIRGSYTPSKKTTLANAYFDWSKANHFGLFVDRFENQIELASQQSFFQELKKTFFHEQGFLYYRINSRDRRNIYQACRIFSEKHKMINIFHDPEFFNYFFGLPFGITKEKNIHEDIIKKINPLLGNLPSTSNYDRSKVKKTPITKFTKETVQLLINALENEIILSLNILDSKKVTLLKENLLRYDQKSISLFINSQIYLLFSTWLSTYKDFISF